MAWAIDKAVQRRVDMQAMKCLKTCGVRWLGQISTEKVRNMSGNKKVWSREPKREQKWLGHEENAW